MNEAGDAEHLAEAEHHPHQQERPVAVRDESEGAPPAHHARPHLFWGWGFGFIG